MSDGPFTNDKLHAIGQATQDAIRAVTSPPPGASAGREPSYWENQWRRDVMDPHLSDNMRLGIALCLIGEIDSRNVSLRSALAAERAAGAALPDFRDAYRSEVDKALAKGLRQEVAHELGLFATYLVGKAAGRAARALAADRETEE